jgi:predicted Zn-dependent peptidase
MYFSSGILRFQQENKLMYQMTRLKNGLRIATGRLPGLRSVSIGAWVAVGGRHESKRLSGISHFLEHLLFKGTRKRTYKKIKEDIEGVGGSFNGFTAEECTCYYVKVLAKQLEVGIDVLCDMVRNASLRPEDVTRERTVILEEIKMYVDMPAQHVHELLSEAMWPNQPLGASLAGTFKTVSAMKRSDIAAHKARFYHPKNIVISVSGDVNHQHVVDAVQARMSGKSRFPASRFGKVREVQRKPVAVSASQKTEQSHAVLGIRSFSRGDRRRYAQDLLNIVTGANMSSRLFNEVREKRGLAYEIRSSVARYQDTGAFVVSAGCEPSKTEKTIRVVMKELGKLKKKRVTADELERAKEFYTGQFQMALEDSADHMIWLGEKAISDNRLPNPDEILRKIKNIRAEDLQAVARDIFRDHRINFALISPLSKKDFSKIQRSLSFGN